jgi:cytochrome c oxidase assembly protein Cox11
MLLVFYTGEGCGLCEQAEAMLNDSQIEHSLKKVNVRDSTDLYHQYGARIPVLFRPDTQQELPWPFNPIQLDEFLR